MDSNGINLLRTQSVLSQEEVLLLGRIKLVSFIAVICVVVVGIFVGGAYFAAKLQHNQLEDKRVSLSKSISAQAKKQILLLSLQDRIPIIKKTLDAQYPWDKVVENLVQIVGPPYLKTLAIGQNNILNVTAEAKSLEDIEAMITESLKQTQEKKIRSPQISSMTIAKDGGINITFIFIPIL